MRDLSKLTEEEKNLIREQYTGILKVNTEKFNNLVETKLGDAKPLSESVQMQQMMMKAKKCYDPKNFPNLTKLTGGSLDVIMGLIWIASAGAGEFFSMGLSTALSAAFAVSGGVAVKRGYEHLYNVNKKKIEPELRQLVPCIKKSLGIN